MTCHPFDLLMELEPDQIRLDCAALHLARDAYPHIDVAAYLARLDVLTDEVAERRPGLSAPQRYEALRAVLVEQHGFHGNAREYHDPDNSYLNRVLDRRLGIPIALATIWIEIARRLKWPVSGVAFPGHFLARFDDPERFILVDPFNAGQPLSLDDCRTLLRTSFNGELEFSQELIEPVDTRTILTRMLNNLRSIYLARRDWDRLAPVLCRLAAVEPENGRHLQELASLHYRQGDVRGAYAHLAVYLERLPDAEDRAQVRYNLQRLAAAMLARN